MKYHLKVNTSLFKVVAFAELEKELSSPDTLQELHTKFGSMAWSMVTESTLLSLSDQA